MKRKFYILFFCISVLCTNVCYANFFESLKQKRQKAIENIREEKRNRQNLIQKEKSALQKQEYLNSQTFKTRKIIFFVVFGFVWIFICIFSIVTKPTRKDKN